MRKPVEFPNFRPGVGKLHWRVFGWAIVRPVRKIMWYASRGSFGLTIIPRRDSWGEWKLPNIHYWVLYQTLGNLASWLNWRAWTRFCTYENGWRKTYPIHARIVHGLGKFLSYCFHGGSCYHCGSFENDQVGLSEDDTGKAFTLTNSGTSSTMDGTDHWFEGYTTCQKCGFQREYSDSSL